MRRYMPEFVAVPLVLVLLGLVFVILWAADAGLGAWLAVGAVLLVAMSVAAVVAMRRPRGTPVQSAAAFDGGPTQRDTGFRRVLLVVDGACTGADLEQLASAQRRRVSAFVVAPAVSSRLARWTGDEHAYAEAEEHLEAAVRALHELGVEARGHVGSHDPLQAADDGLREFPADELVFVLAGERGSAWLENGVVDLARERYDLPVRRLASATPAA